MRQGPCTHVWVNDVYHRKMKTLQKMVDESKRVVYDAN